MNVASRLAMPKRLMKRFRGELFLSLCRTFVARGVAALGALMLGVVLGRLYGAEGVGVFALAQSVILGAGIIARFGLNSTLMRYVSQDSASPNVPIYLRWSIVRSSLLSIAIGVLIWACRQPIADFFGSPALAGILTSIALAIPAFTLSFVLAGFLKGIGMPARASLQENGSISLLAAGCILVFAWMSESRSLAPAGWGFCLAAWLICFQGAVQTLLWLHKHPDVSQGAPDIVNLATRGEYFATAHSFIVLNLSQFLQQVLSVFIAGALLSHGDLGLFKSAERVALMISFILMVINAVFPPRFARLYHQGKHDQLKRLARQSAMVATILALPLAMVCFVFPQWVLGWFGDEFRQAANLLRVIAIGQLINVITGAVGFLLTMTGHEKAMRNISLVCSTLGTASFFVLIPPLGALGAACSLMLVLVLQNVVAAIFVWKTMGIVMLPIRL